MKPLWLGVFFLFLYGLFSMKGQAAEEVLAGSAISGKSDCRWYAR